MSVGAAPMARLRLLITGRVQGVGFRFAAFDQAQELGVAGWVRNLASGEVEIEAEGREDQLRVLAAWAHHGPRAAHVSNVLEEWTDFADEFEAFRIR
jgi:acylphosphatase